MKPPTSSVRPSLKRRVFQGVLALYLVALAFSHLYRWFQSDFNPRPNQEWIELAEIDGDQQGPDTIQMAFVDSEPQASSEKPSIILLHGSPAASPFMMRLHRSLAQDNTFRVITPDLPGFEGSSRQLNDYSFAAHARYLEAFLDSLSIAQAHLIGYSMSGGVVADVAYRDPDRVASLVLMSTIGAQELELLGDYHLNHSIHGLQLAFLWGLSEFTPHFGWMDRSMLGVSYARNFFDSDQRPLRKFLTSWEGPTLLIHGRQDELVPYAAAIEHRRIVPQSSLVTLENAGHGLPITHPDEVSKAILEWLQPVEANQSQTKRQANLGRLTQSRLPFDASSLPPVTGFSLVILMLLIAVATFASEDLASIGAGLMVARGTFGWDHALLAVFVGILAGDIALYVAGRILGRKVVTLPPFSWYVSAQKMDRGAAWFEREGAKVIIASRFIPGSRLPTYVAAGVLKAPFWKFLGFFMIATIFWTPFIVGISFLLGNQILSFWEIYESFAIWVLIGVILLIYALFHIGLPMATHKGRRKLLSRWKRISRWEFWPPFVFYPPVVAYVLFLAIKYRSLMIFTASNPGIPGGGFVGESKKDMLDLLPEAQGHVARFVVLNEDSDYEQAVSEFMTSNELSFPIVLKPDVGDRGHGVLIADSLEQIATFMGERNPNDAPVLLQEFIPGEEFGVFYARRPSEERGSVISVTEKQLISVHGDGRHTLEELILDDERAVCMAPLFFKRHMAQLDTVIPAGEHFQLVHVGTHARGALFLDANHLITPELEAAFDTIAASSTGFYFGRFDIRTPSADTLKNGGSFHILELNGVTSEATHIYDPNTSLWTAYRTLFEQWDLAFAIGKENVARGSKVAGFLDAVRLIFRFKIQPDSKPDTAAPARA
ncbi:MAG: alpha/beta fold hydrolase [Rhodothermales bacterium]|nr:alpha/beta fold hydrolase [Rhodothermales bacterium]MDG2016303.1 alpha/beta fold hydrolase [Rhodothermales bacterium]